MPSEELVIRTMTADDVELGIQLGTESGWNHLRQDWQRLLDYEPQGCFVGCIGRQKVATVTTTCYGTELAWIGMMLVHPEYRRRGIATALMRHALDWLDARGIRCIKLDATPDGAAVYRQLGFQAEWEFQRYQRDAIEETTGVERMTIHRSRSAGEPGEFRSALSSWLPTWDTAAFGVNRSHYLRCLAECSRMVIRPEGIGMLRPGLRAAYLGPVLAQQTEVAAELIQELLQSETGELFWDVPGPNLAACELAVQLEFRPVRTLLRMWRGEHLLTGKPEWQYALACPATG